MPTTSRQLPRIDDASARALLSYMREETEVRLRLATLLEEMQPHLVSASAGPMRAKLGATEPLLRHLEELGRRRNLIVERVLKQLGLQGVVLKLSALVQISPPDLQPELDVAHKALSGALRKLTEVNRRNALVAKSAITFNRRVVQCAFGEDQDTHTYDRNATTRDPVPLKSFLDQEL